MKLLRKDEHRDFVSDFNGFVVVFAVSLILYRLSAKDTCIGVITFNHLPSSLEIVVVERFIKAFPVYGFVHLVLRHSPFVMLNGCKLAHDVQEPFPAKSVMILEVLVEYDQGNYGSDIGRPVILLVQFVLLYLFKINLPHDSSLLNGFTQQIFNVVSVIS